MAASDEKVPIVTLVRAFGAEANRPQDKSKPVIAGTFRIFQELKEDGYNVINPDEGLGNSDQEEIRQKTAHLAIRLPEVYRQAGFSDVVSDLLACKAMREVNAHLKLERVLQASNIDPELVPGRCFYQPSKPPVQPSKGIWQRMSGKPDFIDRALLFNDPYILQFSTKTGLKQEKGAETHMFSPRMGDANKHPISFLMHNKSLISGKLRNMQNLVYRLFPTSDLVRNPAGEVDISKVLDEADCRHINEKISRFVDDYHLEYEVCRQTLGKWLSGMKRSPEAGWFNHYEQSKQSGAGAALADHNIPIRFRTHGGLVVHGDAERLAIVGLLSRTIYNEPEQATVLLPRSPMQIYYESNKPKIESLPNPFLQKPVVNDDTAMERPFRVLLAANHMGWHLNYHGVTMSCFEAVYMIRWLANQLAGNKNFPLNIRVKTTAKDKGLENIGTHRQGMLPSDFDDLYDRENGIANVSGGSHQQVLHEADIVVSEGVTAVFFEALEFRKPLLLLNRSSDRAASLPGFDLSKGKLPDKRHAIYCATCEESIIPALERIRQLHQGMPLQNHELENLVWI